MSVKPGGRELVLCRAVGRCAENRVPRMCQHVPAWNGIGQNGRLPQKPGHLLAKKKCIQKCICRISAPELQTITAST